MADNDLKALLNELVDFEGIVKKIANALKEDLEKEVLKSDEGDKIANKLGSLFEDKENINQFIDNTVEEAQYLAQQKEGARKDAEKLAAMLKDQAKQAESALNEEECTEVKEDVYPSDQAKAANPESLVSAVEWFFDLIGAEEDAHKFAEELQLFLPTRKKGNFGITTNEGVSYGKYSLYNNRLLLQTESGSAGVEYHLTADDITNSELRKELFPPSEEYESAGPDMCSCGNEYCDEVECIDHEYDEDHPDLYGIIEDIEETEKSFYDVVEVILQDIVRYYSRNMPTVNSIGESDENAMRFFLTHSSTLYSPAAITSLDEEELLHEFQRRMKAIDHSK